MPRGSNSEVEESRVKSREYDDGRSGGKSGSGAGIDGKGTINKLGYGSGSMQKNKENMRKSV